MDSPMDTEPAHYTSNIAIEPFSRSEPMEIVQNEAEHQSELMAALRLLEKNKDDDSSPVGSPMDVDSPEDAFETLSECLKSTELTTPEQILHAYLEEIPAELRVPEDFWSDYSDKIALRGRRACVLLYRQSDGRLFPRKFQLESTLHIWKGMDSEVDAGCGSGKTLCLVLPALEAPPGEIALVVCPLKRLQEAQVAEFARYGIRALAINEDTPRNPELWKDVENGVYSVLIVQPEQLSMFKGHLPRLARLLRNPKFAARIKRVHIDEAHFIHIAGIKRYGLDAFRPAWGSLGPFRLKLPKHVRFQSLSGTQPPHIKKTIREHLLFSDRKLHCVKISSNRKNICYATHQLVGPLSDFRNLDFILPDPSSPWPTGFVLKKGIIFHDSTEEATDAAEYLDARLPQTMQNTGIVRHFHAGMSKPYLESVFNDFCDPNGKCRILHATEMASTGLDIRDVAFVVQYGITSEVSPTLQRGGRCGRDGITECIFLIMYEPWVKEIALHDFVGKVWDCDDPDQPHSGDLDERSKKRDRIGIGMVAVIQDEQECLRRLYAKASGDTTDDAHSYTGRFCCSRHSKNGFRFSHFFPGKMLYSKMEGDKQKLYYGDVDRPFANPVKAPAKDPKQKAPAPVYRSTKERPALTSRLAQFRHISWKSSPQRAVLRPEFILTDENIKRLAMFPTRDLLEPDFIRTQLGQTEAWAAKWVTKIVDVFKVFDAEKERLKSEAEAAAAELKQQERLKKQRLAFENASQEVENRFASSHGPSVRSSAQSSVERTPLALLETPQRVFKTVGADRIKELAKLLSEGKVTAEQARQMLHQ
ncbi:hypothetical protein NMY22_g2073 [Coprinellus aureogranulatus]|nr:hypothetical protein NMY22_g2073 [Coprinellus aureogranulatus]